MDSNTWKKTLSPIIGICAIDTATNGIGNNGDLLFNCPEDLAHFKKVTSATPDDSDYFNILIAGPKTYSSLPRSLFKDPSRIIEMYNSASGDPEEYISDLLEKHNKDTSRAYRIFIIGGLYAFSRFSKLINMFVVTELTSPVPIEADTIIPLKFYNFMPCETLIAPHETGNGVKMAVKVYRRANDTPEGSFIAMMESIINNGSFRANERTGDGTYSLFGQKLSIDISSGYCPLLMSRRMSAKLIVNEFRWYLTGNTDTANLAKLNGSSKTVWDGNTSREFLDSVGLQHYKVGDLGATYGFQYRHFGAEYIDCDTDYTGKGVDQVSSLIDGLSTDPQGRRHIVSLWNPVDLPKMALPPCLRDFQFYTRDGVTLLGDKVTFLDVKADQRSSDFFLAGFWNVYQIAYFVYFLCDEIKKKNNISYVPGTIIVNYGDIHIYKSHISQCKEQMKIYKNAIEQRTYDTPQVSSFSQETGFTTVTNYTPLSTITGAMTGGSGARNGGGARPHNPPAGL
jgi:thymidylate synthase